MVFLFHLELFIIHHEIEVGVGIRLVVECVVPPFICIIGESMLLHHSFEQQSVFLMGLVHVPSWISTQIHSVGRWSEIVEMAAHVHLLL